MFDSLASNIDRSRSRDAAEALAPRLEAMLFAAGRPVAVESLAEATGTDVERVEAALARLEELLARHGLQLVRLAGGWQLVSRPEHAEAVRALLRPAPERLTQARLETLAVIAYRQPVSRAEIEAVRGVDCQNTLRVLLDLELVELRGRRHDRPGRPLLYGTTSRFLEIFGLASLDDLPTLEEIES